MTLINLYKCDDKTIEIQNFIPYLPFLNDNNLSFNNQKEIKFIENIQGNKKKILFYPASFWAHKNHKYLIDSALELKKKNIFNFNFVFCGSDRGNFSYIKKIIDDNDLNDCINIFSFASDLFVKKIYQNCFAVVMPTNSGPTNLPLYESMYFRKPIFYSEILSSDRDVGEFIIPINIDNSSDFVDKLLNISDFDLDKKLEYGENYFKQNCNIEKIFQTYSKIIKDYKKIYSKWHI